MFLGIYFHSDDKLEPINSKKIKFNEDSETRIEVGEEVLVPYKTQVIDEAGREKILDVDYKGTIVFSNKGNIYTVYT